MNSQARPPLSKDTLRSSGARENGQQLEVVGSQWCWLHPQGRCADCDRVRATLEKPSIPPPPFRQAQFRLAEEALSAALEVLPASRTEVIILYPEFFGEGEEERYDVVKDLDSLPLAYVYPEERGGWRVEITAEGRILG